MLLGMQVKRSRSLTTKATIGAVFCALLQPLTVRGAPSQEIKCVVKLTTVTALSNRNIARDTPPSADGTVYKIILNQNNAMTNEFSVMAIGSQGQGLEMVLIGESTYLSSNMNNVLRGRVVVMVGTCSGLRKAAEGKK